MSPTTARGSKGKLYRYYVSAPLQQGRPRQASDTGLRRVAATQIEARLAGVVNRLSGQEHAAPLALVRRVEVHADHVRIRLPADRLTSVRERLAEGEAVSRVEGDRTCRQLIIPMRLKPQSRRSWIEQVSDSPRQPDLGLVGALRQAHAMMERDTRGLPTLDVAPTSPYRRRLIRLALLAPDLQKQILDGRQPPGLTVTQLIACDLPLSWPAQRAMIQALATNSAKS